ncbi:MAG: hypothetical protein NTW58_03400 [Actinobacteria bacterium]|nr:hypothetical protein [Actinomycetota bacterium]
MELTKANTGLPDTVSRRWSVWGRAPDGSRSRVTTPLTPVDAVELPVALVPLPVELAPRLPDPLDPPLLPPDEVGRGAGVDVLVGAGVGVGVLVVVTDGDGEGEVVPLKVTNVVAAPDTAPARA